MRRFTVAATQVEVRNAEVEQNLDTHLRLIAETAEAGCELVVFPELSVTGHNASVDVIRSAEPQDGPILQAIHAQARLSGIVVGYGFAELHRGTHYNSFALVGRDGLIGLQRKVHASLDEFLRFRQAHESNAFELGFCTAAVAICHDSDFFETWRILALRGAEVILLPHANRTMPTPEGSFSFDGSGREALDEELMRGQAQLLAEQPAPPRLHDALARDNCVYAIFSDQVGFDGHSTHVGGAYILAPDGGMLARRKPGTGTSWISAELDPALLERVREAPSFALRKRRPDIYGELTTPA
jgi:predicted amidohydrolase